MIYKRLSVFVLFSLFFFSFTPELKAYSDSLLIQGKVKSKQKKLNNIEVKVYLNNTLFKHRKLNNTTKFKLNVPLNEIITVEISADDHHSKRFMLDSHVPKNPKQELNYLFEMHLFSIKEMEKVNTSLLDFPIGLVAYDNKKGFIHNKQYTQQMKKEYVRLLEQSKRLKKLELKSK